MSGKIVNLASRAYRFAPYLLLIPVLLIGFLPGPVLLGVWESLAFYHTFGAVEAPLSFLIVSRADIGGQGYALLEIARAVVRDFHLPLNLFTVRIASIAFGLTSVSLFFIICRRYFGPWPAIGATALLASNQVFFQVEHMMSVLVISGAALLFLLERLQTLEVQYWDVKAWVGMSLSMALVALHYGPGRIFAVILIGLWFAKVYWILKGIPGSNTAQRGIWILAGYSVATLLLVLTILDYRNLIGILRFKEFLFPRTSDIAVLQYLPDIGGGGFIGTVAKTLAMNMGIMFDSMFAHVGNYHSQHSSYFLADFRYPLLDRFVLLFVIPGLIVALIYARRRTILLATPWGNILAMLAVFSLPLLFSLVFYLEPEGLLSTLSVHRMYFCLIPLHLLVAAFLCWLGASGVGRFGKVGVALCLMIAVFAQVGNLINEQSWFEQKVFAAPWQKHGAEVVSFWDDRVPNLDRRAYSFVSHFQQHAQYANVARRIADELHVRSGKLTHGDTRRIVFVDVNNFSETPISPASLAYIAHRNFHSIFLALYAGQEGVQLNPVVMVAPGRRPIRPDLLGGLVYGGEPREYSALMDVDEHGSLAYEKKGDLVPVIVKITGVASYDILVTTPEEEEGARSLLNEANIPFDYVRL